LFLCVFFLGWIGFGVPDWQAFRRYNGSTTEYYGLWAYCQEQSPSYNSVCKRWPTAASELFNGSRPNFVSTSDGLITTGMIFLSLGLITAIFAAILPLLAYVAAGLTFLAFLFLIIGVPIFGQQSNSLSQTMGDTSYNKRYGFWLMIPTILFTFFAAILFLIAAFLYQRFGYGNLATHSYTRRPYGGQQMLGPANVLRGMPYAARPGYYGAGGMMGNPYQNQALGGYPAPSLLSQYIAQRMPRYPAVVRRTVISTLPQPSAVTVGATPAYVTPAYYRAASVARPSAAPVINLTGRALYGPVVRSA
jgi:hypothetical protein